MPIVSIKKPVPEGGGLSQNHLVLNLVYSKLIEGTKVKRNMHSGQYSK